MFAIAAIAKTLGTVVGAVVAQLPFGKGQIQAASIPPIQRRVLKLMVIGQSECQPAVRRCRKDEPVTLQRAGDDADVLVFSVRGEWVGKLRDPDVRWLERETELFEAISIGIDEVTGRGTMRHGLRLRIEVCSSGGGDGFAQGLFLSEPGAEGQ